MKTRNNTLAFLFLLSLAFAGCSNNSEHQTDETTTTSDMPDTAAADMNTAAQGGPGEGDALAMLNAVNHNEIAAATEAQKKKLTQPVMEYANMLHKEHSENMEKTNQLASSMNLTLADNQGAMDLKKKGADELAMLSPKDGKDFEMAYLDAMIKGHTEALAMIDNQLMPMAASDPVKQHLTDTRGHVAMHLDTAKKLKGM